MSQPTIAIIGGGLSGLSAAYHAQQRLPNAKVILLEASDRLGGLLQTSYVQTESLGDFVVERSADMFTTDPPFALELCKALGKESELLETIPVEDRAFVATDDSIHPVPRGLSLMLPSNLNAILESNLLSDSAKKRLLEEENVPARTDDQDESLESFAVRRFGQEVFEQLIQPLASGIYTADPAKLSMRATMARFVDMEREYGSLIAAAKSKKKNSTEKEASGARYGLFRSPKNGMGELIQWLLDAIPGADIRRNSKVTSIAKSDIGWTITVNEVEELSVDGLVVTGAAALTSMLLRSVDSELSDELSKIKAASSAIVIFGIARSQLTNPFDGYGIIYPTQLGRQAIALSFASNKFSGRAPENGMLVRCFIGGAMQSELVDLEDDDLLKISLAELEKTVGFSGSPVFSEVQRWRNCMPQYHLGHMEIVDRIDQLVDQHQGLALAGNSYRGVGIPACIHGGCEAINRLASVFDDG